MKKKIHPTAAILIVAVAIILVTFLILWLAKGNGDAPQSAAKEPKIDVRIIKMSDYTYDGEKLGEVKNLVVHYVANPGSTAIANRNYFNSLSDGHGVSASAHFIIGLDGEIIQCVPIDCVAWANGNRESNLHSISIECCHPTEDGHFNEKTLASLRQLLAWLCEKYSLDKYAIIRHYDVTGKDCPRYFVAHPDEWEAFRDSVFE